MQWDSARKARKEARDSRLSFGVTFLDDALRGIFKNDTIIIAARSGRGKTTFMTQLAIHLASSHNVAVHLFALESDVYEIEQRLLYTKTKQLFFKHYESSKPFRFPRYVDWFAGDYADDLEPLEKQAEEEISKNANGLRIHYSEERVTIEDFQKVCSMVDDGGNQIMLVDHLHFFDTTGQSEVMAIQKAINQIREFTIKKKIPVVVASHVRKTDRSQTALIPTADDLHGHSDIQKQGTTVIMMAPASKDLAHIGDFPTYFYVPKFRKEGSVVGYVGVHTFDADAGGFSQKYFLAEYNFSEDPKLVGDRSRFPFWAKNAIEAPAAVTGIPKHFEAYEKKFKPRKDWPNHLSRP